MTDFDMLDGNLYDTGMFRGPCMGCEHLRRRKFGMSEPETCDAFPDAIPLEIFHGRVDHDIPRPELGQLNNVVFEPLDLSDGG